MIRIPASEFERAFGALSDLAEKDAVAITKQGRDYLVLMPAEEYLRLKRQDRQARCAENGGARMEFVAAGEPASAPASAPAAAAH